MKENNYILHTKTGVELVKESQAVNNALEQEKSGISPRYAFRGWLVWSTYADGCGVVYRRHDWKMIFTTGMQGDFTVI